MAEAVRAVSKVGDLSRAACRRAFEERFDAARMARDYVEVYRGVVGGVRDQYSTAAMPEPALRG